MGNCSAATGFQAAGCANGNCSTDAFFLRGQYYGFFENHLKTGKNHETPGRRKLLIRNPFKQPETW
jgi:hypothetical protein